MRRGWSIAALCFACAGAAAIAVLTWKEREPVPLVLGGLVICAAVAPLVMPGRRVGALAVVCLGGAAVLTAASVGVLLVPAAFCAIVAVTANG